MQDHEAKIPILKEMIESCWEDQTSIDKTKAKEAVSHVLDLLDKGLLRVATKNSGAWEVHQWLKKAILLSFKLNESEIIDQGVYRYFDKVDLKFSSWNKEDFEKAAIRVVPGAVVRKSAFIGKRSIIMPSFVNIGAFIDEGTMVDTWATVGSCAQIGKNCHISGGAGIGGVLEPLQAGPVIIEDNCFIGARSEVVEGVVIREGSVLSMGVYIGKSTKIYDRETGQITYGEVPPYSVVVPGGLPYEGHSLYAAIIIKKVDEKTRSKVSINDLLRT